MLLLLLFVILACFLVYLITLPATPPTLQTANPGAVLEAGQTLELGGTAPADSIVRLWDSGKRVDEARADARGAYKFAVPNIAAGAHAFKTVIEVNGNAAESTVLNLTASVPVVMLQPTATAAPSATATLPPTATPTAALVAGTVQRRGKDNAEMVYVPAGEFTAGAGVTQTVYLEAYWLDRLEVTNEQFEQFVQSAGYKTEAEKIGTGYDYVGAKWEQFPGLTWLTPRVGGL